MQLAIEQFQEIRVWALPQESGIFRDELICVVKDNPIPEVFRLKCRGCKPIVKLIYPDNTKQSIDFDRLLLNQESTQTLVLKNACQIPVNWKLKISGEGGDDEEKKLPEEFSISQWEGHLTPCQETQVNITFRAIEQRKIEEMLILDVEDNEKMDIHQPE
jgi:hypothetical protein